VSRIGSTLALFASLASCGPSNPQNKLSELESLLRAEIKKGVKLDSGLALLSKQGFLCKDFSDRTKLRGLPSYICQKSIERRDVIGVAIDTVTVRLDSDNENLIYDFNIIISKGGLSNL
jgi:hypothetical protein